MSLIMTQGLAHLTPNECRLHVRICNLDDTALNDVLLLGTDEERIEAFSLIREIVSLGLHPADLINMGIRADLVLSCCQELGVEENKAGPSRDRLHKGSNSEDRMVELRHRTALLEEQHKLLSEMNTVQSQPDTAPDAMRQETVESPHSNITYETVSATYKEGEGQGFPQRALQTSEQHDQLENNIKVSSAEPSSELANRKAWPVDPSLSTVDLDTRISKAPPPNAPTAPKSTQPYRRPNAPAGYAVPLKSVRRPVDMEEWRGGRDMSDADTLGASRSHCVDNNVESLKSFQTLRDDNIMEHSKSPNSYHNDNDVHAQKPSIGQRNDDNANIPGATKGECIPDEMDVPKTLRNERQSNDLNTPINDLEGPQSVQSVREFDVLSNAPKGPRSDRHHMSNDTFKRSKSWRNYSDVDAPNRPNLQGESSRSGGVSLPNIPRRPQLHYSDDFDHVVRAPAGYVDYSAPLPTLQLHIPASDTPSPRRLSPATDTMSAKTAASPNIVKPWRPQLDSSYRRIPTAQLRKPFLPVKSQPVVLNFSDDDSADEQEDATISERKHKQIRDDSTNAILALWKKEIGLQNDDTPLKSAHSNGHSEASSYDPRLLLAKKENEIQRLKDRMLELQKRRKRDTDQDQDQDIIGIRQETKKAKIQADSEGASASSVSSHEQDMVNVTQDAPDSTSHSKKDIETSPLAIEGHPNQKERGMEQVCCLGLSMR